MIFHALEDMLILQAVSIEQTPSTKRQYVDEVPNRIQPESKRPRIEVNGSSLEENRSSVTTNSNKPTEHTSKNYYRWRPEHLIAFSWLEYDIEHAMAKCRFAGCKMYHI